MTYREYLTSEKWKKRRQCYFDKHLHKCRACNSEKRIQLHHKTYRRLGEERDADLVPLCFNCHKNLHAIQKRTGTNLWIATEEYIRSKRKRFKSKQLKKRKAIHRSKKKSQESNRVRSYRIMENGSRNRKGQSGGEKGRS